MKGKNKLTTALVILATFILAGVAIFTAIRLYQLRQQPVAPNVPSSIPRAQEVTPAPAACSLSFTLTVSTPTPTSTPSGTPTSTPTGTPSPTPTGTPGPSATPNSCGGTCGSNFNCGPSLVCYNGFCRNPSCTSSANCVCGTSAATPAPPSLPESGTDWPTILGAGVGIFVIIGSLLLAI